MCSLMGMQAYIHAHTHVLACTLCVHVVGIHVYTGAGACQAGIQLSINRVSAWDQFQIA